MSVESYFQHWPTAAGKRQEGVPPGVFMLAIDGVHVPLMNANIGWPLLPLSCPARGESVGFFARIDPPCDDEPHWLVSAHFMEGDLGISHWYEPWDYNLGRYCLDRREWVYPLDTTSAYYVASREIIRLADETFGTAAPILPAGDVLVEPISDGHEAIHAAGESAMIRFISLDSSQSVNGEWAVEEKDFLVITEVDDPQAGGQVGYLVMRPGEIFYAPDVDEDTIPRAIATDAPPEEIAPFLTLLWNDGRPLSPGHRVGYVYSRLRLCAFGGDDPEDDLG